VDPRRALPLGPRAPSAAKHAALDYARTEGGNGADGELVVGARPSSAVPATSQFWANAVEHLCGAPLVRRTIVVGVHFPAAGPSASLSSSTFFVGRFGPDRYRVWWQFH